MTIETTNTIIKDATKLDPNKTYLVTADGYVEEKAIDPMKEKWYTIKEATKESSEKYATLHNAIARGCLLATLIPDSKNGHYLIKESDLIEWLYDRKKIRNQKKYDHYMATIHKNVHSKKDSIQLPVDSNGVPMMDTTTVAERVGYAKTSIINAVSRGSLKASKLRGPKGMQWYISETDFQEWVTGTKHDNHKGAKKVEHAEEHKEGLSMVISVPTENFKSLKDINAEIQKLMDYCYKLGFEDGKVSVEHDISDEYNKGFAEGKKQATKEFLSMQEELMAMVKGV